MTTLDLPADLPDVVRRYIIDSAVHYARIGRPSVPVVTREGDGWHITWVRAVPAGGVA